MYQRRLCVLALGVALVLACSTAAPGKVLFEYWFDIGGTSVNDNLRTACSFPDRPSQSELLDALKSPVDWKDNYGLRARAYLTPAADGDYTFWVSGDDNCQLWLSTDDSAANAKLVAQVAGWTPVETWDWEAGQKSAPIALKAGQKYYIEMLLKEGGGGDSITAAWGGPGIGDGPVVIAGGVLTEFVRTSFPAVCPNPVSGSVDIVAPLFTWTAAANGMMDDIYFGTDPNPGFMNKQPSAMALFFYPMPLEPGATYYWRVDTTSTTGVLSTGKVWSFTVMPLTAHFPSPPDGAVYRPTNLTVSWTAGQNAGTYKVYGSEDQAAVAAGDAGALLVEQAETSLDASALLEPLKTYYWRVDTVDLNGALQAGPVWTFSTYDPAGGAVAEYWAKRPASGAPDVVKNVGEINFDWGGGTVPGQNSPDAAIPVDNFSCRWTAELNVPVTGTYKLYEASDDGARLFLNGEKVAEGWVDRGTTEDATGPLELVAGERYQVVMEMYENGGGAAAFLRWSGPGIAKEIIPQGALQMPTMAFSPIPANGAMNVDTRAALTWLAGSTAAEHNVYLGTDPNLVAAGDASVFQGAVAEASFVPAAALDAMTTYYWSVDEVTADGTVIPGLVWSFTVQSSFGVIEITDPTLLIYYDFEFGLGSTVPDMSGHGNHGLFMGNPEWTTDIFGGCLSIDSADLDYIQTETPLGIVSNTVSVTAWVKHDQTPAAWSGILTHRGTSPGCFGLQHNGSEGPLGAELRYMWGADQYWDFSSGLLIPNGEWYFAALTIAPDQAKFYLNGLDQTATNVAEHVPVNFDSLIRVGRDHQDSRIMTCLIDEVRFYNRTLTDADIQRLVVPDVTAPGDAVQGVPNDGDWPGAEIPDKAIDNSSSTKFLHFKGELLPTGIQVTPAVGPTIVTGLTFTTANDSPGRDPIQFELSGSNDSINGPWTLIAAGDIVDFAQATEWPRFTMNATPILFENGVAYAHYQIVFPTLRNPVTDPMMQIAEIELLGTRAPLFVEDFESYAAGSSLQGQGGWKGWAGDPGAAAPASAEQAFSGANSVKVVGSADLVQEFAIAGGKVIFSAMQYIPSGTTGTTYFILMNTYNDPGAGLDWSMQTEFHLDTGQVVFWHSGTASIVYDKWVEVKCVIDLDANTVERFYDGKSYGIDQWDDNVHGTLQAIDLYGNGASPIYYDDITVTPF